MEKPSTNRRIGRWLATLSLLCATVDATVGVAQSIPDTTICRGTFLNIEARNDYEIYGWSPQDKLVWSVNEKAIASPAASQVYTLRARRRLAREYVVDSEFDGGGVFRRSDLRRATGSSFSTGSFSIVSNSAQLSGDSSTCLEISGRPEAKFMAVHAVENRVVDVWCQEVSVETGRVYNFRATTSTLRASTVGQLGFTVAGKLIGRYIDPYAYACTWRAYGVDYRATATETVEICVQVKSGAGAAAKEAIDRISFREYDVDYLDTFRITVLDTPEPREESRVICSTARFREHGLDLGPGETGTARIRLPSGCDSVIKYSIRGAPTLYAYDTISGVCIGDVVRTARGSFAVRRDTSVVAFVRTPDGCDSVLTTNVEVFDAGDVDVEIEALACDQQAATVTLVPNGRGVTFAWLDGDRRARRADLVPGSTQTVNASDARGCEVELEVAVPPAVSPKIELRSLMTPMCLEGSNGRVSAVLSGGRTEGVDFWLEGSVGTRLYSTTERSLSATGLRAGNYRLRASDARGCTDALSIELLPAEYPDLRIEGDTFVLRGLPAQLRLSGAEAYDSESVQWQYSGSTAAGGLEVNGFELTLKPTGPGVVSASLTLDNGCTRFVERQLRRESLGRPLFPSAFSPNGDDVNDRFGITSHPGVAGLRTLHLFDRWGGLVYVFGGDGDTWSGAGAPAGVYAYTGEVEFLDGSTQAVSGTVELMR